MQRHRARKMEHTLDQALWPQGMESEQGPLPVGAWRGCCRACGITHRLPCEALGTRFSTQSLCGREKRNGVNCGRQRVLIQGSQDSPESSTWEQPQYSLSRPSLLGGRRFLWVQWGLGVPEQQDRALTLCWGREEWTRTCGADRLGRECQLGLAL